MKTNPRYYHIDNMHCSSCVAKIEALLEKFPDIQTSSVNFAEHSLMVIGTASDATIIQALDKAGYQAAALQELNDNQKSSQETAFLQKTLKKFVFALIIALPMIISAYVYPFIPPLDSTYGQWIWLFIGLLTLLVFFYSANDIYQGAWKSILQKSANMDTLIALGTGAAWLYSMFVVLFYQHLPSIALGIYFDTAAMIIALVKLGHFLEAKARGKTSAAIQELIGLQPKTALVINHNLETEMPIDAIKTDMQVRIRPGDKIPLDGVILEGSSHVDESMLTGEAKAVRKQVGDKVITGTLNKSGSFIFKVTEVGSETTLAKIVNLVKQAQNTKPAIGRLVDKVAAVFVPIVLLIAIITAIVWYFVGPAPTYLYAMITAVTVLVIACPCALGLGTPMSLMVGIGKAAQVGILIRNGNALQNASKLTTIIFDKTGTLTKGTPEVTKIIAYNHFSEDELLSIAASLEKHSEHPLGETIVKEAKKRNLNLKESREFESFAGKGIRGQIADKTILIGNALFMQEHHIDLSQAATEVETIAAAAATPIFLSIAGQLAGLFGLADPIKADAKTIVAQLQQMGIKTIMLTGDNQKTAASIAKQLGIKQFIAESLPQDKHKHIQALQQQKQIVGMVGDGINDAPALAQADVGFAIGAGTDVAIESADITLLANSLQGVINAIFVSKATLRNIKQNLVGAFAYNILGIPIAAGVLYPFFGILLHPIIAGAAMAASSLTIVLNANRLRGMKFAKPHG